jgi:hypothetical protein
LEPVAERCCPSVGEVQERRRSPSPIALTSFPPVAHALRVLAPSGAAADPLRMQHCGGSWGMNATQAVCL